MPRWDPASWSAGAGASYLGVFFVTVVALGGLGGNWADQRLHTSPLFVILGVVLGFGVGLRECLKALAAPGRGSPPAGSPRDPGPGEQAGTETQKPEE